MPHKKTVDSTSQRGVWAFPELSTAPRIFTRHFANLNFTLEQNELSLLCFLIFMSDHLNQIDYSVKILQQYRQAVKLAQERYQKKILKTSLPTTRRIFTNLIEKGLLIKGEKFVINPNLTYSKQINFTDWRNWTREYNKSHDPELVKEWVKLKVK